jgi:hypothetical protein
MPVGYNYDQGGFVRSLMLGLRLCEIAHKKYDENNTFVEETYWQYKNFCLAQGMEDQLFTLTKEDIFNLAGTKGIQAFTSSLNHLIQLLPIVPYNLEEIRAIHERAKEVIIRA